MRPATDRLRECQRVSGVLNKHERRVVFVSQSVLECHGAVVKTVVKIDAPRFASAGANAGGKISQEFTWCVTACQDVSWRVSASQAVSRTTSRRRFDGLPTSKPGDTVQRMVQGLREVQEVAPRHRSRSLFATSYSQRFRYSAILSRSFITGRPSATSLWIFLKHGPRPPEVHFREDRDQQPPHPIGACGRSVGASGAISAGRSELGHRSVPRIS
jgi:hypothetical protein